MHNKNDIIVHNSQVYRVLETKDDKALVIDCKHFRVPFWIDSQKLDRFETITQEELCNINSVKLPLLECLTIKEKKSVQDKFSRIAALLPVVGNDQDRNDMLNYLSEKYLISRKTLLRHLYTYLVYQDICSFAIDYHKETKLTVDEKNFRYILNKYFYARAKPTLTHCYTLLIRERYTDSEGKIIDGAPSFSKFKYYYYKSRKLDSYYISREGRSEYDRNIRPLLGRSRNVFNTVGYGMVDSTILDIYILDTDYKPRRPVMSAMVDAYSSLCLGFSIGFEGGDKLLRRMILNVNYKYGIPQTIISDNGSDYTGSCFTNLTELGVQIMTNKTHSPHMKSIVERLFGQIQELIKPHLLYQGVVGKNNYPEKPKENSIITLNDLETILTKAIEFYNSKRKIILPFCKKNIKPYAETLFEESLLECPNAFVKASDDLIRVIMLPRTKARFTRQGLRVGKLLYRAYNYVDDFLLAKREVAVAYNPENVSKVWVIDDNYAEFELIESFFANKTLNEVNLAIDERNSGSHLYDKDSLESRIKLGKEIEEILNARKNNGGKKQ